MRRYVYAYVYFYTFINRKDSESNDDIVITKSSGCFEIDISEENHIST